MLSACDYLSESRLAQPSACCVGRLFILHTDDDERAQDMADDGEKLDWGEDDGQQTSLLTFAHSN